MWASCVGQGSVLQVSFQLISCKLGTYKILKIKPLSHRLLEMGFIPGKFIQVIANNGLGIKVRINNTVYLINKMAALIIYVEPTEE